VRHHLPYRRIALVSFVAYVFSHNVGLSFFGGGAVRFRMLSSWGLSAQQIARVVAFSLLTFWLGFLVVGGVVHTAWPLTSLPWAHPTTSRPIGLALLALLSVHVAVVARRREPLHLLGFQLELPSLPTTAVQLLLSSVDWLLAALVLYSLFPAAPAVDFTPFLAAYLLAIVAGLVSHVPAGLGVFETVMLVLLRGRLPGDQILAAIVAYRIIYYVLPLAVGVGLFTGYELRQSGTRLGRARHAIRAWAMALAPRLFAVTTFLAGALLLLSGATPELPERLAWLREILPLPLALIEISKLLGSVFGVFLLLLANALRQRIDAAYYGTLALLAGGVVVSLVKGLDWEEASILATMGLALLPCRSFFYRRSSLLAQPLSPGWWLAVAVVAFASLTTLDLAYRHVEYSHELWWRFAPDAQAPRSLRALLGAAVALLGIGVARLLRPSPPLPDPPTAEDLDRAQAVVARSARVDGYLALLGDKDLLFDESGEAFLMFGVSGRTWVAMGDPVGTAEHQEALAWRFRELVDRHGGRTVFYEISDEMLPVCLDLGLRLRKLGEAGRVPLHDFSLEGARRAPLRHARNRMSREGCRFELLSASEVPAVLDELQVVSDEWLRARSAREKRFSLGFFDRDYLRRLPVALVRRGDAILGFANVWTSGTRQECSIDLMRYRTDAPAGVMDYLFTELMLWARDEGYAWFSLGMAPLSGFEQHRLAPLWNRLGALLFRHGEHFYNFQGLRDFKDKFDPDWQPRYLAAPSVLTMPIALTRIARLVSGGTSGRATR
jgi:phosphatidylglycerol lysyltransferase